MAEAADIPSVQDAWTGIRRRKHRYVIYELGEDQKTFKTSLVGARTNDHKDLAGDLPDTHLRAVVFDHEFTMPDGRKPSKLYFLTWKPRGCNQRDKIAFAAALAGFRAGFAAVNNADIEDEDDIEALFGDGDKDDSDSDF